MVEVGASRNGRNRPYERRPSRFRFGDELADMEQRPAIVIVGANGEEERSIPYANFMRFGPNGGAVLVGSKDPLNKKWPRQASVIIGISESTLRQLRRKRR
jgi:hypothetical protein